MSIVQQNAVCPAILVGLEELTKNGVPYELFTQVGFAQSLLDPINRGANTVVQNVDAGQGHPKTVRIKYKQRATTADTTTSKDCADGTEKPYFEDLFNVNMYRQHTIQVKEATLRSLCDYSSQIKKVPGAVVGDIDGNKKPLSLMAEIVMEIMMDFDALRQAINRDLQTAVQLKLGNYVGGDHLHIYNMYRQNTTASLQEGSAILSGFNRFKQDMRRTSFPGTPLVVGEGALDLALGALEYGCCNNSGNDLGALGKNPGFKYYTDFTMGSVIDPTVGNGFLAYMPGQLQLATYNEYVGGFASMMGVMERGTIPDPALPGISYDIRVIPVACTGSSVSEYYNIIIGVHFDLWSAPTNMFKSGDRLVGVNGVVQGIANAL